MCERNFAYIFDITLNIKYFKPLHCIHYINLRIELFSGQIVLL